MCGSFWGCVQQRHGEIERVQCARRAKRRRGEECGGHRVYGGGGLKFRKCGCEVRPNQKNASVAKARVEIEVARSARREIESALGQEASHSAREERARRTGTANHKDRIHGIASSRSGAQQSIEVQNSHRTLRSMIGLTAQRGHQTCFRRCGKKSANVPRSAERGYSDLAMSDKYERLLDYLVQSEGWITASELADQLGVTTRSVRSYVTAAKAAAHPLAIITASTAGYRLNREAYSTFVSGARAKDSDFDTPRDRVHHLVRRLTEAPQGLDIHALADSLFVSESTIEADLRKVKALGEDAGVSLSRRGSVVTLTGAESDHRRLLSKLFHSESAQGFLELENVQREFASDDLGLFKTDLIEMLDAQGYFVNEYGVNSVLLHVAIAVDRVIRDQRLQGVGAHPRDPVREPVTFGLATLISTHFDVILADTDLEYLAKLLTTRVITPGQGQPVQAVVENYVDPENLELVRTVVAQVSEEYLLDLNDEAFMVRLALHLGNLVARAQDNSYSRNPLVRSIKTSYPMIYDVAVFMASQIQRAKSITMNDDEISYIALHLGSFLERQSRREERLTVAIVCPGYYDMHTILRERIESALGSELSVEIVVTRTDVDWLDFSTDLVLTTIAAKGISDSVVVIQPFLTDGDIENIRRAITRVRRHRKRAQIKDDLLLYFDPALFLRNVVADSEVDMIRTLGELMVDRGIIDESYVAGAVERELMSSTAFTDTIAVPHAMVMSASKTSIAIAVNETPMQWGDNRVNVIALIAFSSSGRSSFQEVFDQFVEVFADRADVLELIKRSTDFTTFIEELVHVIDT
jgi:lichenan operon transcriptional antiterminator